MWGGHMTIPSPKEGQAWVGAGQALRVPQPGLQEDRWKTFAYEWNALTGAVVLSGDGSQALGTTEREYITGRQILPKVHPDDVDRLATTFAALTPARPETRVSCRLVHPDQGVTWVEAAGRAVFDRDGGILRVIGTVADMTRRVRAGELATANALLQLALDAGKSVAWDWDVQSGRDTWFGDLHTIFGIAATSYCGHVEDFRRRIHQDDRKLVWSAVSQAMESRGPYSAEFRIVRPDGMVRWVAAQGKFHYTTAGLPERMFGIAVDITERKVAGASLRRKEIELSEAQRLAGVGSWQWDSETDTVVWSEELYRIAGRDPKLPAVRYADHSQLYTPESWERLRLAVERALSTGATLRTRPGDDSARRHYAVAHRARRTSA